MTLFVIESRFSGSVANNWMPVEFGAFVIKDKPAADALLCQFNLKYPLREFRISPYTREEQ